MIKTKVITGGQVRMARAYLKWSAEQLAENAGVALSTVKRIEAVDGLTNVRVNSILSTKNALTATKKINFRGDNGVDFIEYT